MKKMVKENRLVFELAQQKVWDSSYFCDLFVLINEYSDYKQLTPLFYSIDKQQLNKPTHILFFYLEKTTTFEIILWKHTQHSMNVYLAA
jgi:hypothetical protein